MKTEKLVLSFIALLAGLLVAGIAFYLYQSTKVIPAPTEVFFNSPSGKETPAPSSVLLTVDTPANETVVENKTIIVSGKTAENATVIVSTDTADEVVTPAANGNFSTSVTIGDGENIIEIIALSPSGEKTVIKRTVTYSTESF